MTDTHNDRVGRVIVCLVSLVRSDPGRLKRWHDYRRLTDEASCSTEGACARDMHREHKRMAEPMNLRWMES